MTRAVKAWWEETSEYFQDEIELDVAVNWTGFGPEIEMLDSVEDADILELGCGGGQCTVSLAERGGNIVGMDLTRAQLDHARTLAAEYDVDIPFVEGDITSIPFDDGSFDVAFNSFVLQWVNDLEACFREAHRVLRPGGRLVFSLPHPFYRIVDPDTHEVTDSYFDTGKFVIAQEDTEVDQTMFHHSVGDVYSALAEAGFDVTEILEPGTADPADYEEGPWGEHTPELMSKVPAVLVVDARK